MTFKRRFLVGSTFLFAIALTGSACQSSTQKKDRPGSITQSSVQAISPPDGSPSSAAAANSAKCESIGTQKPQKCLAVQYVAYSDGTGQSTLDAEQARANLKTASGIWSQCGIAFTLEQFLTPEPSALGLKQNPSESNELPEIRKAFESDQRLLVVTTGEWNRNGSLGSTGANAWATVPGTFPTGVVLEDSVATFGNIVAHELGHLLGLDHSNVKTNLMSPIIYDNSTALGATDCETASQVIDAYWTPMLRDQI